MSDEPRQEPEEDGPEYEAPEAEELSGEAEVPSGFATGSDERSDRNLKTEFAEVDVEAVLARVRGHRVDL
jgi:hypothetical protein